MDDKLKVEYSIVSIGTENSGSHGYICVSEADSFGNRYICPFPHFSDEVKSVDTNLRLTNHLTIEEIAVLRFQLIAALALRKIRLSSINNACVIGAGAIGIASYLELQRCNVKTVSIKTRREQFRSRLQKEGFCVSYEDSWNYDLIIECTGNKTLIKTIFDSVKNNTTVLLMGTPRNGPTVDLLQIHRRNLSVIGGHELNGVSNEDRQAIVDMLSKWYAEFPQKISSFVRVHNANQAILEKILAHQYVEPINVLAYKEKEITT